MGQHTDIQWADSTVNPTTGCDGCELWKPGVGGPCYAGNFHEQRLAKSLPKLYAPTFDEVRLAPGRMAKAAAWPDLTGTERPDKPWLDGLPRIIFVGDMGDIFSEAVPFEYLRGEVIAFAMSPKGRRHVWMLLTKQPQRMAEFGRWLEEVGIGWPENVWAGTSLTNAASRWRIRHLLDTPARYRYLSVEPVVQDLGAVVAEALFVGPEGGWEYEGSRRQMVQLVIIGGESAQGSNRGRPFDINWARRLIADCRDGGASPFIKQFGANVHFDGVQGGYGDGASNAWPFEWHKRAEEVAGGWRIRLRDSHGGDWDEWPADLRVREFPGVVLGTPA